MDRLRRAYDEWIVAIHWLTRIPWPYTAQQPAPKLAETLWAFPLVGALVGTAGGLAWALLQALGATPLLAAVAAVIVPVLLTGLLHEDGFADFCDGMGCRGTAADRLAAMRDSRLGVFGAAGLALLLLVRVAALASFASASAAAVSLALSHAAGRFAIAPVMLLLPLARTDGAAVAADRPQAVQVIAAALALALVWLVGSILLGDWSGPFLAVLVALALAIPIAAKANRRLDGYTGDVLGAIVAVAEAGAITALALAG
ncbi:adenosylcobinamide-GDP ribazoletransferase [Desertibaculum subflavum]|uniref:adenosylcobinamide-GDP ribazoletransferase n=1 Tax=Desertibaculum subflavum TaxID=2268458 RepID=UPI000E665AC4